MAKCNYAREISEGVIICNKYGDYCLLDTPDSIQCDKLYGSDENYNLQEAEYEEDEDYDDENLEI